VSLEMTKLQGKVAVVTGAGSGMGKSIAMLFAKEGAKVIAADINGESLNSVVDEICSAGGVAKAVVANVTKEEDVQNMINEAVNTYGTLDILVNNAGIMDNFTPAEKVTDDLWERVFAVNSTGPMRTIRKAIPVFIEKKSGNIINIASVGGLSGSKAGAAYTASKHALVGLTKNVGFQYVGYGIRCNAIAPGAVKTNIGNTMSAPDKFCMDRAMAGINLNPRVIEPEEIARVALFLACDDSSAINGAIITTDAGWTSY
jgi:NAD(P)-dependent dehydrogenase (short-subunit alcohol dehydrogenase family)